ncbi:hypothetical protein D7Y13_11600 [Corallococcus praedator]|uniref:Uncharacterized protein n=1 Tax=Corallococcus praedator TaxID=2316724 RepID=A0ABX9QMC8_9BACT|nr:hypothetical protein D7X75_11680 [Corallococcus sp. CA031C]RKI11058.1 hypothetical protein D7Y13_11600 [Corallococcus praedator]
MTTLALRGPDAGGNVPGLARGQTLQRRRPVSPPRPGSGTASEDRCPAPPPRPSCRRGYAGPGKGNAMGPDFWREMPEALQRLPASCLCPLPALHRGAAGAAAPPPPARAGVRNSWRGRRA